MVKFPPLFRLLRGYRGCLLLGFGFFLWNLYSIYTSLDTKRTVRIGESKKYIWCAGRLPPPPPPPPPVVFAMRQYRLGTKYRTHYAQMSQATFFDKISQLQKPILCLTLTLNFLG